MNSVNLTGRIGHDLELRASKNSETKILELNIAVKGKTKDSTDWITCKAFNQQAEYLSKYAGKGSLIGIEGRLQVEAWEDSNGANHRKTVVVATRVEILSGFTSQSEQEVSISDGDLPF